MKITANYCKNCDRFWNKDKHYCATCFSGELEKRALSGNGVVYSYTNIYAAPKPFDEFAPYYIILVDLEEGLRITARYNGDHLQIGKEVEFEKEVERAYVFKEVAG
jgi:uncharacterized OB-fold protein